MSAPPGAVAPGGSGNRFDDPAGGPIDGTGGGDPGGLTAAEAARRLLQEGPNSLPEPERRTWRHIAFDAASEPMFLLLCGAALLYLLLGSALEGGFLLLMVAATVGMTLYQEGKTEHALRALRQLGSPQALVLRDGTPRRVAGSELVAGDVILLVEGARVPADARLCAADGLLVDESLLTGESVPVRKLAARGAAPPMRPGGEDLPWVYSGTLVVQGHGSAIVTATGPRSEIGRIGDSLRQLAPPPSPLQRQSALLARRFAVLGLAASALLVLILGLRGGGWLEALLAGIALSISMLPEEFTVVLTVFPALGAWRLARANVLTRRLAAIETLGATSVLCVDKTGTLTENRMALHTLWCGGVELAPGPALPPTHRALLRHAILATPERSHDPMEHALQAQADMLDAPARPAGTRLVHEYGLTAARRALMLAWQGGPDPAIVAAKGAPESILALCRMEPEERAAALAAAAGLAARGLRVLAVAGATHDGPWPDDPAALPFGFLGLCALADPLRADIPDAVAACRAAGLRVVMITGDHPATAQAIAGQAGIAAGDVVNGAALDGLDDTALAARLSRANVCARIVPEQKLRIVQALQRGGAVVAMTGDGVNDAPALRAADVGVAMGLRGTDVAREAAQLTLLDDRFASIVDAVQAGRRIFDNMRKSMAYIVAVHVPIAGMALLPALLGWPAMLYPAHIVFLELVIDPACALVFENEPAERDLMRRPPRPRDMPLFSTRAILRALGEGAAVLAVLTVCYGVAAARLPADTARAFGFASLVLANLALLLSHRVRGGGLRALAAANPLFWGVAATALAMLAATLYVPLLARLFHFAPLTVPQLVLAAGVGLAIMAGLHLARAVQARLRPRPG